LNGGMAVDRAAFARFEAIREDFRRRVAAWTAALPGLADAQRALALEAGDEYTIETPVVYNRALDDIRLGDDIPWIVVADNPGKREQEAGMNRYLVGRSGLVAERFFARELGVDFRRQVLIINKTPVHTPKTVQLRALMRIYPEAKAVIDDSQRFMASIVPALQECFGSRVWVMGLSEVRPGGLFGPWQGALADAYAMAGSGRSGDARDQSLLVGGLYGFNHFSMGSFATDLKRRRKSGEPVLEAVMRIGGENRARILGNQPVAGSGSMDLVGKAGRAEFPLKR
jgi:hypothetical protein